MKNQNRLTTPQLKFLYAVRDEAQKVDDLTERLKVRPWLLSKWLRRPAFRQALAESMKENRRRHKLEFQLGARNAGNVMAHLIAGGKGTHLQRQACYDMLELHLRSQGMDRKVAKRKVAALPEELSLIHPSLNPEEALRHIEIMEGRSPAD